MADSRNSSATVSLTEDEDAFAAMVAEHYFMAHGVPHHSGRTLGYLMICDPPEQRLSQLAAALGVARKDIDPFVEQMTLAEVFERTEIAGDDDCYVRMLDNGWPHAVAHTFASWPSLHEVLKYGLDVLADAPADRRARLVDLEELFRYLVTELPSIIERYHRLHETTDDRPA